MIILALDASGPAASVAVWNDGLIAYQASMQNGHAHACELLPMTEETLHLLKLQPEQVDYVACVAGPGSFTGVRIGVATAQGYAQPLNKPCIAIDALEVLAKAQCVDAETVVCAILDARAGQVYGAAFRNGQQVVQDCAEPLPEFLQKAADQGEKFCFVGDACANPKLRAVIEETLGEKARIAPAHLHTVNPAYAAMLAAQRLDQAVQAGQLRPIYLRQPQAERERLAREAKQNGNV